MLFIKPKTKLLFQKISDITNKMEKLQQTLKDNELKIAEDGKKFEILQNNLAANEKFIYFNKLKLFLTDKLTNFKHFT